MIYKYLYNVLAMKDIIWVADTLENVRSLPQDARREVGFELFAVQSGREHSDWKPMPSIGQGVKEIRIHTGNEYRVIYVAKFTDKVYILHAFIKKSQKTPKRDIDLAKERYRALLQEVKK